MYRFYMYDYYTEEFMYNYFIYKSLVSSSLTLLFLLPQVVQFNAHEVSEFVTLTPKSLTGAKNETIGAAIYPTLALFNHSCHGAQVR